MNLEEIYTELIAEHSRTTENRRHIDKPTIVTTDDVDRLIDALKKVRKVLRLEP